MVTRAKTIDRMSKRDIFDSRVLETKEPVVRIIGGGAFVHQIIYALVGEDLNVMIQTNHLSEEEQSKIEGNLHPRESNVYFTKSRNELLEGCNINDIVIIAAGKHDTGNFWQNSFSALNPIVSSKRSLEKLQKSRIIVLSNPVDQVGYWLAGRFELDRRRIIGVSALTLRTNMSLKERLQSVGVKVNKDNFGYYDIFAPIYGIHLKEFPDLNRTLFNGVWAPNVKRDWRGRVDESPWNSAALLDPQRYSKIASDKIEVTIRDVAEEVAQMAEIMYQSSTATKVGPYGGPYLGVNPVRDTVLELLKGRRYLTHAAHIFYDKNYLQNGLERRLSGSLGKTIEGGVLKDFKVRAEAFLMGRVEVAPDGTFREDPYVRATDGDNETIYRFFLQAHEQQETFIANVASMSQAS